MFNLPKAVFQLPDKLKNNDNNPTVTYQLGKTIRNKTLNYKETFKFIFVHEDIPFCISDDQCECADSSFCDPDLKYIITGGLQTIENTKLRKLLTKSPNYRES